MKRYRMLRSRNLKRHDNPNLMVDDNVIHLNIKDTSDMLSPYCEDDKPVINSDFASFLENSVKDVSVHVPLIIKIESNDKVPSALSRGIRNYYKNEFIETERELRQNLKYTIVTFIVGIITLILSVFLSGFDSLAVIGEAIDIVAWVFVWESVDLFFLRRRELKYKQYREINFMEAIIEKNKVESKEEV